jgi:hypothetical protein
MKKSTTIILVVIALLGAGIYFYYAGGEAPESPTLGVDSEVQASADRVLILLNQIRSLKINPDIFSSAAYQTLQDNAVPIPALPVGRTNPFAPVPGASNTNPSSTPRPTGARR